jgi:hypothetical protein
MPLIDDFVLCTFGSLEDWQHLFLCASSAQVPGIISDQMVQTL